MLMIMMHLPRRRSGARLGDGLPSEMVFWLCVLAAAKSVLRFSYSKLEHQFEWHPWTCVLGV